jgi:hypothetical protein
MISGENTHIGGTRRVYSHSEHLGQLGLDEMVVALILIHMTVRHINPIFHFNQFNATHLNQPHIS